MSYTDYQKALKAIKDGADFPALLLATMRTAPVEEQVKLQKVYPTQFDEMVRRGNTKDGFLPTDPENR